MYRTKTSPIERSEVLLHGWDSQSESWHGPIPLAGGSRGCRQTLTKLRAARGAFQGRLNCSVPGLPCMDFHTAIYDLGDTGLALVHVDGAHAGPVGILSVVPHARRKFLRNDFVFELMTVISFLGSPVNHGCELNIHDYMEEALRADPGASQVFAVETAELDSDAGIVLSAHFEQLAAAMLEWLSERESNEAVAEFEECSAGAVIPVGSPPATLSARCVAV